MTQTIIGLEHPIEDNSTGVQLHFHVLRLYQVDVVAQRALVTFSSYASQAAFEAGKNPVAATTVNGIAGVPSGDAVQWGYEQVLASAPNLPEWAGAVAVHAAPAEVAQ